MLLTRASSATSPRVAIAFVTMAAAIVGPAHALERVAARAPENPAAGEWAAAGTCTVRYYNDCTGWVWVWSGWSAGEEVGTAFHGCCPQAVLTLTNHLTFSGIGTGWGFTGTIGVYAADADLCPTGPPLASQPWRPSPEAGWYSDAWNVSVPRDFVVKVTWQPPEGGFSDPTGLASDRPAAGPTGPEACGVCFPSSRTVRSCRYGNRVDPYCPGQTLHDGVCDAEFLVDAVLSCPVHVEEQSWGRIKTLYR